jgi:hypothetical protein
MLRALVISDQTSDVCRQTMSLRVLPVKTQVDSM